MFEEFAFAAEVGAEGGSPISVVPSLAEMWPSLVAFIILFVLLKKVAFGPITGMLQKRADTIRESLEKAEETKVEAERLLEEYKVQMAEARSEAAKLVEHSRKVAESMKDDIVAKANDEAAQIVARAREAIEAEKQAAMADLQAQVADISVLVAGKLIGEKLSTADHAKLIERYVSEVGRFNDN